MLAVLLFSFFHAVIGSDYANAKADLSLRWAHASEGTFSHDAGITKVMYGRGGGGEAKITKHLWSPFISFSLLCSSLIC